MGFWLKKTIGFWMMPMSFCMALIAIGLVLFIFSKRQSLAKTFSITGLLLLFLFSWHPFSNVLLRPIEQTHSPFDIQQTVDYVLVLGNGVESDKDVPKHSNLSSSATARLLEGLRIIRAQPNSTLIVSGYKSNNTISCAQAYADLAISMGVDPKRIIKLEEPKDTYEEAVAAKNIIGDKNLALVTSASHMPRAFKYFQQQNINTTTAPTFYLVKYTDTTNWRFDASALAKSERAIYEYIGMLWQWLKYS